MIRTFAVVVCSMLALVQPVTAQEATGFRTILQLGIHQRDRSLMMAGLQLELGGKSRVWPNLGLMLGRQEGVIDAGVNLRLRERGKDNWFIGFGLASYDIYSLGPFGRIGIEHSLGRDAGIRFEGRLQPGRLRSDHPHGALVVGISLPPVVRTAIRDR